MRAGLTLVGDFPSALEEESIMDSSGRGSSSHVERLRLGEEKEVSEGWPFEKEAESREGRKPTGFGGSGRWSWRERGSDLGEERERDETRGR
jgi:hypothetical protein